MNNDWREYQGDQDYLAHFGIKGMHWGVRRFEKAGGGLTPAGKKRYGILESKSEREANKKTIRDHSYEGQRDKLVKAVKNKNNSTVSKRQLKKEAKILGKMYDKNEREGYLKSGNKLETYTGKKYFDLVDSIESTAAKRTAEQYTKKYGDIHIDQLNKSKVNFGAGKVAYWLKQG